MNTKSKDKYTIYWSECHNPYNWADDKFKYQYTLSALKNGIRNIINSFPTKSWHFDRNENDGWIEIECELTTRTLPAAIKLARENCINNGVDVFSILKNNKVVFTEENL